MRDFIKHSMIALGSLVKADRRCCSDGEVSVKTDVQKKKELALRIESCSQTVSQIKELLAKNSISTDIQEHFQTLQYTLENMDVEKLEVSDVENIEKAINRALKAIAQFLPDSIFEDHSKELTH